MTLPIFLNFDNPEILKAQIENLQPSPGTCIFIDICGSTAIKQQELKRWIFYIDNTIKLCFGISHLFRDCVLKLIGDAIMIYIPDTKKDEEDENYNTILDMLINCISSTGTTIDPITLKTKAAVHYCTDPYNITYNAANDYYSNDIDLTARLMEKSKENEIVISERYYQKVFTEEPEFFKNTSDKLQENLKGISELVEYRIMTVQ
jgi:class 3 adenylate cyclase